MSFEQRVPLVWDDPNVPGSEGVSSSLFALEERVNSLENHCFEEPEADGYKDAWTSLVARIEDEEVKLEHVPGRIYTYARQAALLNVLLWMRDLTHRKKLS